MHVRNVVIFQKAHCVNSQVPTDDEVVYVYRLSYTSLLANVILMRLEINLLLSNCVYAMFLNGEIDINQIQKKKFIQ